MNSRGATDGRHDYTHLGGGRDGYRYSVLFEGKLLVDRSREPSVMLRGLCWPKASPAG